MTTLTLKYPNYSLSTQIAGKIPYLGFNEDKFIGVLFYNSLTKDLWDDSKKLLEDLKITDYKIEIK